MENNAPDSDKQQRVRSSYTFFSSQPIFSPFAAAGKASTSDSQDDDYWWIARSPTRPVTCHITFVLLQPATSYLVVTVTKLPGAIWIVPPKPSRSSRPISIGFNWPDMVLARPRRVFRRYRLPVAICGETLFSESGFLHRRYDVDIYPAHQTAQTGNGSRKPLFSTSRPAAGRNRLPNLAGLELPLILSWPLARRARSLSCT